MAIALEAYTAVGRLGGHVVAVPRLPEMLETLTSIVVEGPQLIPNPGTVGASASYVAPGTPWTSVDVDALLVVAAPPDALAGYRSVGHRVRLHLSPYIVEGELPSLPGFDPGRALARPTGSYVLLARVRIVLQRDVPGGDPVPTEAQVPGVALRELDYAWVNRYAVERVVSNLELGRFFPGAGVDSMVGAPASAAR